MDYERERRRQKRYREAMRNRIIAAVSRYMTLRMGDLIYTGTPAGVGPVSPGDNLRAVLEGRELLSFDIR